MQSLIYFEVEERAYGFALYAKTQQGYEARVGGFQTIEEVNRFIANRLGIDAPAEKMKTCLNCRRLGAKDSIIEGPHPSDWCARNHGVPVSMNEAENCPYFSE